MRQRRTQQLEAIRAVFENADRPLNPQEVLDLARARVPQLGIATVYRNLKALVEEEWLAVVELAGEPSRYERADHQHHHHFHCEGCGRLFDVPGCTSRIEDVKLPGFDVRSHAVTLYGLCPDCR